MVDSKLFRAVLGVCAPCNHYIARYRLVGQVIRILTWGMIIAFSGLLAMLHAINLGLGLARLGSITPQTTIYELIRPDALLLFFPAVAVSFAALSVLERFFPFTRWVFSLVCDALQLERPAGFILKRDVGSVFTGSVRLDPGIASSEGIGFYSLAFVEAWNQRHTPILKYVPQRRTVRPSLRRSPRTLAVLMSLSTLLGLAALGGAAWSGSRVLLAQQSVARYDAEIAAVSDLYAAVLAGGVPTASLCQQHCSGNEDCLQQACIPDPGEGVQRLLPGWSEWRVRSLNGVDHRCPDAQAMYNYLQHTIEYKERHENQDRYSYRCAFALMLALMCVVVDVVLLISIFRDRPKQEAA